MEQTDSVKLMFKSIVAQHSEFAESMRKFDLDLCKMGAGDDSPHTIEEIRKFLKEDLVDHFSSEEDLLFPAALMLTDEPEVVQLIIKLLHDHWDILHRLGYLEEKYPSFLDDSEHSGAEVKHARALLQDIQEHNYLEMREFYPRFQGRAEFMLAIEQCRAIHRQTADENDDENGDDSETVHLPRNW